MSYNPLVKYIYLKKYERKDTCEALYLSMYNELQLNTTNLQATQRAIDDLISSKLQQNISYPEIISAAKEQLTNIITKKLEWLFNNDFNQYLEEFNVPSNRQSYEHLLLFEEIKTFNTQIKEIGTFNKQLKDQIILEVSTNIANRFDTYNEELYFCLHDLIKHKATSHFYFSIPKTNYDNFFKKSETKTNIENFKKFITRSDPFTILICVRDIIQKHGNEHKLSDECILYLFELVRKSQTVVDKSDEEIESMLSVFIILNTDYGFSSKCNADLFSTYKTNIDSRFNNDRTEMNNYINKLKNDFIDLYQQRFDVLLKFYNPETKQIEINLPPEHENKCEYRLFNMSLSDMNAILMAYDDKITPGNEDNIKQTLVKIASNIFNSNNDNDKLFIYKKIVFLEALLKSSQQQENIFKYLKTLSNL